MAQLDQPPPEWVVDHSEPEQLAMLSYLNMQQTALIQQSASIQQAASVQRPALIQAANAGRASLLAVFGGQGTHNALCLQELRKIYLKYEPQLSELFKTASVVLKEAANRSVSDRGDVPLIVDLMQWIHDPDSAPPAACLATAPFSFPINGLLSFAHYVVACHLLKMHPGQLRDALSGTTGHSQGIIVATAIAASGDWPSFTSAVEEAMDLLYLIGYEAHTAAAAKCLSHRTDDGSPALASSMLSVRGMRRADVQKLLDNCNALLDDADRAYLGLMNSHDSFVISGPTKTLLGISAILEQRKAPEGLDQDKIPFPKRQPTIDCQLLPISAPFHSAHLTDAAHTVIKLASPRIFGNLDLAIPLYHTANGGDISFLKGGELLRTLVHMVMCETVHWPKACIQRATTHILDFGPGRTATMLYDHMHGSGLRFISMAEAIASPPAVGGMHEPFSSQQMEPSPNWAAAHGPKLVRDVRGNIQLSTRMSQVLGLPPVMVAGMTPTTVPYDFVSSVMNAGYHIELAGGGYSQPQDLRQAFKQLASTIPTTRGVTINLIYADPKAMAWQVPLIRALQAEGHNIEGLTIGAGIPSPDVAQEYISSLGLRHISFKPSSVSSIQQVLDIADFAFPFPVILQWTGGRAGGHHSYEDLHGPILKTYGSIRKKLNVVLAVGSGFGDAKGILPYLTGQWSEALGYPRMPFDGALLGSRMMVAKEAHTSTAVKQLIVDTPGVSDAEWHRTYEGAAGGIITVKSQMGQPIHKIANRAVMLWYDLDKTIFSIKDEGQRLAAIDQRRDEIISRLNHDYAKPWFAMDSTGQAVDIQEMTYAECLTRLTALMYMHQQQQWIHPSYQTLFIDFLTRAAERFGVSEDFVINLSSGPFDLLDELFTACNEAVDELLYPEDAAYLLAICGRRGQKPVNFIPVLDANFETWFKKDSLWQAEKLEAVVDQDPQRVCCIHGPVAARHSTSINQSAADILDEIYGGLIMMLSKDCEIDAEEGLPVAPRPVLPLALGVGLDFIDLAFNETPLGWVVAGKFSRSIPDGGVEALLNTLRVASGHWLALSLTKKHIVYRNERRTNRAATAFRPLAGDTLRVEYQKSKDDIVALTLFSQELRPEPSYEALSLASSDGNTILFKLERPATTGAEPWRVTAGFFIERNYGGDVLHYVTEHREENASHFYASCWSLDYEECSKAPLNSVFSGASITLTKGLVQKFVSVMARARGDYTSASVGPQDVPIDIGIIVAWQALCKPLLSQYLGGDLSRLLHRSNRFEYVPDTEPFQLGDVLHSTSTITAMTTQAAGKLIEITASIQRDGKSVMTVISEFFLRGNFAPDARDFRVSKESCHLLSVVSPKIKALLTSRRWFKPTTPDSELLGTDLQLTVRGRTQYNQPKNGDILIDGEVHMIVPNSQAQLVGTIELSQPDRSVNPVVDFLERYGTSAHDSKPLELPGWDSGRSWTFRIPDMGAEYSNISADHNPIHVSHVFAGFAGLDAPIVHGMYTSALVRSFVEKRIADTDFSRFTRWSTSFEDVVYGGDLLRTEIEHVAMRDGAMVLKIQVFAHDTNRQVMTAEAEIKQPPTAYLFCGQGSQVQGMGMVLYESDDVVREIWTRGDRHLFNRYGFSILDVVRNNPKRLTVHFGTAAGRRIRDNYLALTKRSTIRGKTVTVPVIEGLSASSTSITFEDPSGVLFSTQFAQPAISLLNTAEMEALRARGLIQKDAHFAGHSLGEYSGLLNCAGFMTLEDLLELTFYRGTVMQNQMSTGSDGKTDFSMVAVNPSRIHKEFDQVQLSSLVEKISTATNSLLEIVNYNIAGQQYVCAGHLRSLWLLGRTCEELVVLCATTKPPQIDLDQIVRRYQGAAKTLPLPIDLQRGAATVPLPGVNVPFHSSFLRPGIQTYREYLQKAIRREDVAVNRLVGKFVPNLTGRPFATSKAYVREVAEITGSQPLNDLLQVWG